MLKPSHHARMKRFATLVLLGMLLHPAHGEEKDKAIVPHSSGGWRFWDQKAAPHEDWHARDFDDTAWKEGTAPMGYGREPVATTVSFGEDPAKKHASTYFRRVFELEQVDADAYVLEFRCDDGVIIYVNGMEMHRFRVPEKLPEDGYSGILSGPGVVDEYAGLLVNKSFLKEGKNVIAIQLLQGNATSSDLYLDLRLQGLSEAELEALKNQARPQQESPQQDPLPDEEKEEDTAPSPSES